MARRLSQLLLLTQKNLIVIRRSKLWFACEVAVGLLLLPLIIIIASQSKTDISQGFSFEPIRVTGDYRDLTRRVPTIGTIWKQWCLKPQKLAYIATTTRYNHSLIDQIFGGFHESYEEKLIAERFDTLESMMDALKRDLNRTRGAICGSYIGGVHIIEVEKKQPKLVYTFLIPQRGEPPIEGLGAPSSPWTSGFWLDEDPYSSVSDLNAIPSSPGYWSSGFLSIQFAIESAFLKLVDKAMDYDVYLQRMPMPPYRSNGIIAFLKFTPTVWALIALMSMLHMGKNIVEEKESGIKTYMMVMGMRPMAFYGSHFFIGLLKVVLTLIPCAAVLSVGFLSISPSVFVVLSLLYALDALLFAALISVLIRKPAFTISAILLAWVGLVAIDFRVNLSLNELPYCMLASLNPITAFKLGVKSAISYESRLLPMGWFQLFSDASHSFTVGMAGVMLALDAAVMLFLVYYIDSVCPTDDSPRRHPLFFFDLIKPRAKLAPAPQLEAEDQPDSENMENERGLNRDEADIDIRNMSKIWEGNKGDWSPEGGACTVVAVDKLNLRAYRGQITVLLGHNGAGKSTTFSVVSGVTSSSGGDVYICRESVKQNLPACQSQIGYCPQYNPLFPKLTVREHLCFYAKLKAKQGEQAVQKGQLEAHIESLAEELQLKSKLDTTAQNLSGGMKRKLSMGMALIGGSKVILLDEPTAGMDPEARNEIRLLLAKRKKQRTILLTTHYMDEADFLGDRIAILVKGRLVCNGSPEFLKKQFGTGYILSVVLSATNDSSHLRKKVDNILKVIRKHAPDARVDRVQTMEFSIILPVKYRRFFADMFEELEARSPELGIHSFGLSLNTLEQVFIKVGELAENEEHADQTDSSRLRQIAYELFHSPETSVTLMGLLAWQLGALLTRHFLGMMRNKMRSFLPIVSSLLIFVLFGSTGHFFGGNHNRAKDLSLADSVPPITIPLLLHNHSTAEQADFAFIAGKVPRSVILPLPFAPSSDLQSLLRNHSYDSPPLGFGAAVFQNRSTQNGSEYSAHMLFNGAGPHTPPLALSLLSNAMLKDRADSVHLALEVYDVPVAPDEGLAIIMDSLSNIFVSLVVVLAFSLLTSTFAMPLVEDRERKFKNQMLLTELAPFTYWLSVAIWNAILYIAYCLAVIAIFHAFGWLRNALWSYSALWALYFWCCMPFVYCASFFFNSPLRAYTALATWNIVLVLVALVFANLLGQFISPELKDLFYDVAYIVLPSFPLGDGMLKIAVYASIPGDQTVQETMRKLVVSMLVSGAAFWMLLFVLESKTVKVIWHQFSCRLQRPLYQMMRNDEGEGEGVEDEDVAAERQAVRHVDDHSMPLLVRELYKYYSRLCAVRNLTFGVRHNECFGLLGVNGAGKTSTFDILTGNSLPSSGSATIGGIDVSDAPTIGYCPQFDALPMELTGREVLTLLARLCHLAKVKLRVDAVLQSIDMLEHADKQIQHYSGGQRRRLSIGVALILKADVIMLDEPTAGIDPKTRRRIWNLLQAVKEQGRVAILLTSHSMDECEALCTRIGFMNKGSLISIGSTQHLKSKYGNSFLLSVTISNPSQEARRCLDAVVTSEFNVPPTEDSADTAILRWEISKSANTLWSRLFRRVQAIAERFPADGNYPLGSDIPLIVDFSITQNSLEQVFLRLAQRSTYAFSESNAT